MKKKSYTTLVVYVLLLAMGLYVGVNGLQLGSIEIPRAKEAIDLGLDLAGGVYVVLEADTDIQGEELTKIMNQTKTIMEERVNGLGIADPSISVEGTNRIRIELAGIDNPQEAIDIIGKTAQLQFVDPEGEVILTGQNVVNAEVNYITNDLGMDEPVVALGFDKEGGEKFAEATERLTLGENVEDRILYIVLDDQIISYPSVKSAEEGGQAITDGKATISGNFDLEGANHLATLIRGGSLPVEMIEHQTSVIGPTLGLEAYEKSIKAAGIALGLIFVFMLVVYKLLGIVAVMGLITYTLITIYTMSVIGVKLTLPGIAGMILSIGMAVDANVLIFERIREELKTGKTIRTSISYGFDKALSSVLDSNVTTLIAGLVLYYFGIGPIKGFGVTLIIGIIVSMLTSVVISKVLIKSIGNISDENIKYYGA